MARVSLSKLKDFTASLFTAAGMNSANTEVMTDVLMRATLRGAAHHDIYYLPDRFRTYLERTTNLWGDIGEKINLNPKIKLINSFGALEGYDGDNGPGELCSAFVMDRAGRLADEHGIALCTIQNSNCFLAAAPYVERAAEKGYLGIIYTRTHPAMNAPGSKVRVINSSPMGFAAQTDQGFPILLDTCMAYIAYGTLWEMAKLGEKVPAHWGLDSNGQPSTDPGAIRNGGVANPIGGHKGFGLAILTEMLTGVLSGGQILDERQSACSRGVAVHSQTAIAIKPSGLMPQEQFRARTSDIINRVKAKVPEARIPGEQSAKRKKAMLAERSIDLKPDLIEKLNKLADEVGVKPLAV